MTNTEGPAWICSECGTRRNDGMRCDRCGGRRVVLLSIIIEMFGSVSRFEHAIHPATWVVLGVVQMDEDGSGRHQAEEYFWFMERALAASKEAGEITAKIAEHRQGCMRCINQRACPDYTLLWNEYLEAEMTKDASNATLDQLRKKYEIPKIPGPETMVQK